MAEIFLQTLVRPTQTACAFTKNTSTQNESLRWAWWVWSLGNKGYCYNDISATGGLLKIQKKKKDFFPSPKQALNTVRNLEKWYR